MKKDNNNKKTSPMRILILLWIALMIFGIFCFVHFGITATLTKDSSLTDSQTYTSAIAEE